MNKTEERLKLLNESTAWIPAVSKVEAAEEDLFLVSVKYWNEEEGTSSEEGRIMVRFNEDQDADADIPYVSVTKVLKKLDEGEPPSVLVCVASLDSQGDNPFNSAAVRWVQLREENQRLVLISASIFLEEGEKTLSVNSLYRCIHDVVELFFQLTFNLWVHQLQQMLAEEDRVPLIDRKHKRLKELLMKVTI